MIFNKKNKLVKIFLIILFNRTMMCLPTKKNLSPENVASLRKKYFLNENF